LVAETLNGDGQPTFPDTLDGKLAFPVSNGPLATFGNQDTGIFYGVIVLVFHHFSGQGYLSRYSGDEHQQK
jgi:hypothetical protein